MAIKKNTQFLTVTIGFVLFLIAASIIGLWAVIQSSRSTAENFGQQLSENYVGAHFGDFDGFLVLSHFKGHAMAGFGGAIKNISIGIGSKEGKCLIHTAGRSHTSP